MAGDRPLRPAARAEAAVWLARLHAEAPGRRDEAAFRAWLDEDPENRAAFDAATDAWDAAGGLRDLLPARRPPRWRLVTRRRVLEGLAASLLVAGGVAAWEEAQAGIYETGLGEQRRVGLADGSELLLDTDTRVRVRIGESARRVELERGRVNCRVADDPNRPFIIDAGAEQVVASGSSIDVRRDAEQISVVCLDGSAEVAAGPAAPRRDLATGQRLKAAPRQAPVVDRPALAPLVAWQNGQAVFDDTTLADAVAEMNRYSRSRIDIADPRIAGLRISGVYRVGDAAAFAQSVSSLLPVRVLRDGDGIRLIVDPARNLPRRG